MFYAERGGAAGGETKDGLKFSGDATDRKAAPLVDCQLFSNSVNSCQLHRPV